ncbi:NAD(P)/FAD-dependent oxidoreductase [Yoonia sp. SS1-5]|uniref:Flavin monoamine oxidase family protein n=1 Tax=Yoonia rhodophyticola TaxID=3137370 RepID=A0AAN0NHH6_9RHOB
MQTDVVIIGGGLCGLAIAAELARRGRSFQLLEARDRVGGRILTVHGSQGSFDLGPAWFWPGQPRMQAAVARLGLRHFTQYEAGAVSFEDERGGVERGRGFAAMHGAYRLDGGLSALTDALAADIPSDRIRASTPVTGLTRTDQGVKVNTQAGQTMTARQVVLALPPRIASTLAFRPALPADTQQAMAGIATWMAGQAKAVAIYDRPFWRQAGLSDDAISRRGPMVEIHDASTADGQGAALFGFVGLPPRARDDAPALRDGVIAQLTRIFGPQAADPLAVHVKDWAFDPFTATPLDQQPLMAHPRYGLPASMSNLWDDALIFSGTETAPQFGGYLEGALEAAEGALTLIAAEKV